MATKTPSMHRFRAAHETRDALRQGFRARAAIHQRHALDHAPAILDFPVDDDAHFEGALLFHDAFLSPGLPGFHPSAALRRGRAFFSPSSRPAAPDADIMAAPALVVIGIL